jgi:hypothetical protein
MSRRISALSAQTKTKVSQIAKPMLRTLRGLIPNLKRNVVVPAHVGLPTKECFNEDDEPMPSTYLGPPPPIPTKAKPQMAKPQMAFMAQITEPVVLRKVAVEAKPQSPHALLMKALSKGVVLSKVENVARPTYAAHTSPLRQLMGESDEDEEEDDDEEFNASFC